MLLALGMNMVIAIAKFIAGFIGGSASMLSEGAHSVADTINEVFLLASIKQSARPADRTHPFGYGMNRFFWSLLAAVGIFVTGALFSLYEGITGLFHPAGEQGSYWLSLGVLALAFVLEGTSWLRAVRQLRGEARERGRSMVEHVRRSTDPSVKTVFSEDSAALVGLIIAAIGVTLHKVTGNPIWDAIGAICIGVLLAVVAFLLGRDTKSLLIGEAADPELRRELWRQLLSYDEVDSVVEVLTMNLGPDSILVAVRLDLGPTLNSDQIERLSSRISDEISARHPEVTQVFLDATPASAEQRHRAAEIAQQLGI